MTEISIKTAQNSEAFYGADWLMTGNLLTKLEFDRAFKLARQLEYLPIADFWNLVSIAVASEKKSSNNKQEVSVSNLVIHQLQLIALAFKSPEIPSWRNSSANLNRK